MLKLPAWDRFGAQPIVSGGGGYTAKAVHFDGTALIQNASLTNTDSPLLLTSVWVLATTANWAAFPTIWSSDPKGNGLALEANGASKIEQYLLDGGGNSFYANEPNAEPDSTWAHHLIATDTNHASGSRVISWYVNDVSVTPFIASDNGSAFSLPFNGKEFDVGNDTLGDPFTDDMSDFSFWPGVSVLVAGDIPLATRRLFIDGSGKPVNPATAIATLGTPCLLFSGDHTTFPVNQGSGGAFTLTGSLTNASTHP